MAGTAHPRNHEKGLPSTKGLSPVHSGTAIFEKRRAKASSACLHASEALATAVSEKLCFELAKESRESNTPPLEAITSCTGLFAAGCLTRSEILMISALRSLCERVL